MTEYPPGTPCASSHFRPRNRIISGLSAGVVVVEGGETSGALITARAALEQGREVFAVPGNVDAPMSAAPNRLLHDQEATAVRRAADVLTEFSLRYPRREAEPLDLETDRQRLEEIMTRTEPNRGRTDRPPQAEPSASEEKGPFLLSLDKEAREGLTDDQQELLLALEGTTLHPDELVERLDIPSRRVLSALTLLQVQGYVKEENGKRFTACVRVN